MSQIAFLVCEAVREILHFSMDIAGRLDSIATDSVRWHSKFNPDQQGLVVATIPGTLSWRIDSD